MMADGSERSYLLPSVNCVLYTITRTPGFSSNSTRFWFSAFTMVLEVCGTAANTLTCAEKGTYVAMGR